MKNRIKTIILQHLTNITNEINIEADWIQKEVVEIIVVAILLVSMFVLSYKASEYVSSSHVETRENRTIVLDAGHGGDDPGKIGINGAVEKEINLAITKRLQSLLAANDITVVMTREDDNGMYDRTASNKKVQDMKNRLELVKKSKPALVVSVHQNSYHEESIHGAQVFYYKTSEEGKRAAEIMQNQLIKRVDKDNTREEKSNTSYYLLKKTDAPIIIVECGFLSNHNEAGLLVSEEYQEKLAWAIHMGILEYLNRK